MACYRDSFTFTLPLYGDDKPGIFSLVGIWKNIETEKEENKRNIITFCA
jgi:hypothetical protein